MSLIWNKCKDLENHIIELFQEVAHEQYEPQMQRFNHDGWTNRVWSSESFRRAHIDVVDATNTRKLWMMHCCIMPHVHNGGPIYGLDIIAGERKVTGFFLDYSMSSSTNILTEYYSESVQNTQWKKQRELPEWAKAIFSENMVAAGNIQHTDELQNLIILATQSLNFYTKNISKLNNTIDPAQGIEIQNTYAYHQKSNPHTPRVMKNLGLDEKLVEEFCSECLFPVVE